MKKDLSLREKRRAFVKKYVDKRKTPRFTWYYIRECAEKLFLSEHTIWKDYTMANKKEREKNKKQD